MAAPKKQTARRIRNRIIDSPVSFEEIGKQMTDSVAVADTVKSVAAVIENITITEENKFNKLLERLAIMPESNRDMAHKEQKVFVELIKVMAMLQTRLDKTPEGDAHNTIAATLGVLRQHAETTRNKMDPAPRSFKERLGAHYGMSVSDVRERGLLGTMANSYKEVFGGGVADIDTMVNQQAEAISRAQPEIITEGKSLKERTTSNSMNTAYMEQLLADLVLETTIIRKIVEGSVQFDASLSGNKYRQAIADPENEGQTTWRKMSGDMNFLTTPGAGLFSRGGGGAMSPNHGIDSIDEYNNSVVSHGSVLDFTSQPFRSFSPVFGNDTVDEFNENEQRDTGLSRTASSGISSANVSQQLENNATTAAGALGGAGDTGEGGGGGLVSALLLGGAVNAARKGIGGARKKAGSMLNKKPPSAITKKVAAKSLGRTIMKKIPVLGLMAGIGFGVSRALKGDGLGAAGEVMSGLASTIPGVGTAASLGIDAALAARDMKAGVTALPSETGETLHNSLSPEVAATAPTIIDNKTINNYTTPSTPNRGADMVPSIRPTDNSFTRFQDKRQTRVL